MVTVLLGLAGALVYGAADFVGGLASRRISAIRVTALGGASGLVLLVAMLPLFDSAWSVEAVVLGALSGVSGAAAIALLYGSLAIGPMSILSPLTAVVSAIVPLTAGLLRGERLGTMGYLALALALVAVVLVGFVPGEKVVRPSARALVMAVGSGILIGVFLIIIDATPDDSGLVPLVFNRAVNAVILFAVIGLLALGSRMPRRAASESAATGVAPSSSAGRKSSAAPAGLDSIGPLEESVVFGDHGAPVTEAREATSTRSGGGGWRPGLVLAIVGGMVDASANVLLLLGLRVGDLSVVSVLTAMYPAGTIILAAVVLKERIARTQMAGLVLAIAAAALLSVS